MSRRLKRLQGQRAAAPLATPEQDGRGAQVYLDPESWDVLRDTLDELRAGDSRGVTAFERAIARRESHHGRSVEALRDALGHEHADQLVLKACGRLTEALGRTMGLMSGVALLALLIALWEDEERSEAPTQGGPNGHRVRPSPDSAAQ